MDKTRGFFLEEIHSIDLRDLEDINLLNTEGFNTHENTSPRRLMTFLMQQNAHLIVARNAQGRIIGKATLFTLAFDTGKKTGLVHSVVVAKEWQGKGVAPVLESYWCEVAKEEGCAYIDLTSSPDKERANAFYKKNGYEKRDTNVYRKELKK